MSQFLVRVEGRFHSGTPFGTGAGDPEAAKPRTFSVPATTDAAYAGFQIFEIADDWDKDPTEVWLFAPGDAPLRLQAIRGSVEWFVELAAANQVQTNGGQVALVDNLRRTVGGTVILTRTPAILLGGNALATFAGGPPAQANGLITLRPRHGVGPLQASFFLDDAAGESLADPTTFLQRVYAAFEQSGAATLPNGQLVRACNLALTDPTGLVWLLAGDVGNGPSQISPAIANNTAENYAYHPSVFWRRGSAVRSVNILEIPNPTTGLAITEQYGNCLLRQIDRAPLFSAWTFVIEGQTVSGLVEHPAGSDIRRPRDIWNQVIAPLIDTGGSTEVLLWSTSTSGPDRFFQPREILHNLARCELAGFRDAYDDQTAAIWSYLSQT